MLAVGWCLGLGLLFAVGAGLAFRARR